MKAHPHGIGIFRRYFPGGLDRLTTMFPTPGCFEHSSNPLQNSKIRNHFLDDHLTGSQRPALNGLDPHIQSRTQIIIVVTTWPTTIPIIVGVCCCGVPTMLDTPSCFWTICCFIYMHPRCVMHLGNKGCSNLLPIIHDNYTRLVLVLPSPLWWTRPLADNVWDTELLFNGLPFLQSIYSIGAYCTLSWRDVRIHSPYCMTATPAWCWRFCLRCSEHMTAKLLSYYYCP